MHHQPKKFNLLGRTPEKEGNFLESEQSTPDFNHNNKSKLPWIKANNRNDSKRPDGVGILKGSVTTRSNLQSLFDQELSKLVQSKKGINRDMADVDKDK